MVITQANYQIALRLIHSLSRFIPKANQTDHPLTNTNLFLSAVVPPPPSPFQLPSRQSISPSVASVPHTHTHSQNTVSCQRGWSFICIQTTTVNKPVQQLQPTQGFFAVRSRDFRSRDPRLRYASHTSKTIRLCAADNPAFVV